MSYENLERDRHADSAYGERRTQRENNRKRLNRLLNPDFMSAEHHKDVKDYPAKGWQDKSSIGRWDGFDTLWGTYKVVQEQDHQLRFLAYVPQDLEGSSAPLLVSWHGGGFFTGAADYQPWDAQYIADLAREVKAVVVSFNYRLLPYVDGRGLLSDVSDAVTYIHSENGLRKFLKSSSRSVDIDWKKLMVIGESAGGFLAVYTWLKSPAPVRTIYLRYPLLRQYKTAPRGYGGVPMSKERYAETARAAIEEVVRITQSGEAMPAESSLHPPLNMPAANVFSATDRWRDVFQHADILQILEGNPERPSSRPEIFIIHGEEDVVVPIETSAMFKMEIDRKQWAKGDVVLKGVPGMDHGFDYNLKADMEGCIWLAKLVSHVKQSWVG